MIDWNRPFESVIGLRAERVAVLSGATEPNLVVIHSGTWNFDIAKELDDCGCDSDGKQHVRNVPEKRECWVNVYRCGIDDHSLSIHFSRNLADAAADIDGAGARLSRIRVPYTIGQMDE